MDAHIDGVFPHGIGQIDAFLKGEVFVAVTGHHDLETFGLEQGFGALGDFEIVAGFGADRVGGAGIFAAVAGIENHGAEVTGVLDEIRPQDWIDQFREVHPRDVNFGVHGGDGVGKHEFHAVHQAFVAADFELHFDLGVFEDD